MPDFKKMIQENHHRSPTVNKLKVVTKDADNIDIHVHLEKLYPSWFCPSFKSDKVYGNPYFDHYLKPHNCIGRLNRRIALLNKSYDNTLACNVKLFQDYFLDYDSIVRQYLLN